MRDPRGRAAGLCLLGACAPACSVLYDFDRYRFDRADVVDAAPVDIPHDVALDAVAPDVALDAPDAVDVPSVMDAHDATDATDPRDVADVGEGDVADPSDAPSSCDAVALCGGECVDLGNDPAHCGRCEQACPGASGLGLGSCVEGACACLPGARWNPARGLCELTPPRQIAPLSTSRVTTLRPRLRWERSPRSTGARVTLCRNRAMSTGCVVAEGLDDVVLSEGVSPGVWFWRVQSMSGAEVSPAASPVWQLRAPRLEVVGAVNTAWGASLDLNGDGRDDLAVSAVEPGNVFVYTSPLPAAGAPTRSLLGAGRRLASAGDTDGDGYPELIVERDESVSVFPGGPGGVSAELPYVFTSSHSRDAFGYALAAAGDVNRDGYGDVIVGAPGVTASERGNAYIYLGGPAGVGRDRFITLNAPDGGRFGTAVGAGDFNGDGVSDVVVSAPSLVLGPAMGGRVYVYYGPIALGPSPAPNTTIDGALNPATFNHGDFGARLAAGFDLNGDGHADLAVAAPSYPVASGVGQVSIYLGSPAGLPSSRNRAIDAPHGGYFGDPLEPAGDVDGDGYGDLVVAAHEAQAGGGAGAVGRAYLYLGAATGAPQQVLLSDPNPRDEARFGFGVTGLGDTNGDGYDDFAVGDPLDVPNRAHVYLGAAEAPFAPSLSLSAPMGVDARRFGYWIALAPRARRADPLYALARRSSTVSCSVAMGSRALHPSSASARVASTYQ